MQENEKKRLQKFGFFLSGVLLFLAGILFLKKPGLFFSVPAGLSVLVFFLNFLFPGSLKPVETFLLKLGEVLSWISTRIVLTLVFFGMISPLAIILRWSGKKTISEGFDKTASSYWEDPSSSSSEDRYERLF